MRPPEKAGQALARVIGIQQAPGFRLFNNGGGHGERKEGKLSGRAAAYTTSRRRDLKEGPIGGQDAGARGTSKKQSFTKPQGGPSKRKAERLTGAGILAAPGPYASRARRAMGREMTQSEDSQRTAREGKAGSSRSKATTKLQKVMGGDIRAENKKKGV